MIEIQQRLVEHHAQVALTISEKFAGNSLHRQRNLLPRQLRRSSMALLALKGVVGGER